MTRTSYDAHVPVRSLMKPLSPKTFGCRQPAAGR
jgi:hypothetical protein